MGIRKIVSIVGIIGSFFVLLNGYANADGINYSVKANIPENQIDKSKSYFDLSVVPGQKQVLSLTVKNTSNQSITVNVKPTNATTNQNGVIDYSERTEKKDSSLVYPFTTLIDGEKKVKLNAGESKEVSFGLIIPTESFDGIILGGFSISEDTSVKEKKGASEGVQINNEYSFVIGVSLNEKNENIIPNLNLNEVKATLLNYRAAVTLNLQNTKPVIVNNLKVEAKISKKYSAKVLYNESKEEMSMAPNSNFDFPVSWSDEEVKPGLYEVEINASAGDQKWAFKKEFRISEKESKKLNDEAVEVKKEDNNFLLIVICIIILILLISLLAVIVLYRNEKKRKKAEIQLKARRKKEKYNKNLKRKNSAKDMNN